MLKATVVLKSGQKFETEYPEDIRFDATDLTDKTIHRLACQNRKKAVFVQGSNIAYIEIQQ